MLPTPSVWASTSLMYAPLSTLTVLTPLRPISRKPDELDATDWISTFSGLDGTSDSTAKIRRHSTLRAGADFKSTRLVGRSAWNDKWIIVIPASAIDADYDRAMNLIESGVKDIKLGIRAYSRSGN